MKLIHQLSATELAQAIRSKQIRATEAVAACFAQIEQHNDRLKAMIATCRDRAEAEAIEADAAIERGESVGRLHGVPFTAKDLTLTAGVRTTFGSVLYQDYVPQHDELCIARMRSQGAILIGKTNTPEFGLGAHCTNRLYGPTANPYDSSRSSGGSSGGAAVAVSTGMCHLAQGTDMGGSVRTPASFCGVVGLRPAAGRVSRRRRQLLWDYLETDGILARTVEDAALMLSVIAGEDWRDPLSVGSQAWEIPEFSTQCDRNLRLGFSPNLGIATIDSEVETIFRQALSHITPLCQYVQEAHPDCSMAQFAFETIRGATLRHKQRQHYEKHYDSLTQTVRWNIERGMGIAAATFLQAESSRDRLYLNFIDFFEQYDILVTPSTSVPPFLHTQSEILEINHTKLRNIIDYLKITYTISLTGLPAVSIPCGWTTSGLPIGIQLIGKPRSEATLLQFAYCLQETLNFRHRWFYSKTHSIEDKYIE